MDMLWRYIRQCIPHNLYQSVYAKEYCICHGVKAKTLANYIEDFQAMGLFDRIAGDILKRAEIDQVLDAVEKMMLLYLHC